MRNLVLLFLSPLHILKYSVIIKERQTDRQTDGQRARERSTDRQEGRLKILWGFFTTVGSI